MDEREPTKTMTTLNAALAYIAGKATYEVMVALATAPQARTEYGRCNHLRTAAVIVAGEAGRLRGEVEYVRDLYSSNINLDNSIL
jgi:hypothetical protein